MSDEISTVRSGLRAEGSQRGDASIASVRAIARPFGDHPAKSLGRADVPFEAGSVLAEVLDLLQRSLEPPRLPRPRGIDLAAAYRPARERFSVGGDFFEVFAAADGGWTFMLGDVCGKGIEAAMQSGKARQTLHALRLLESCPIRLLELLNQAMLAGGEVTLTTLVIGGLRHEPGGGLTVDLATGGHPAPLVLRADGAIETVEVAGMAIGMISQASFGQARIALEPGDALVAYTDGVTEARGGRTGTVLFGPDRLVEDLAPYCGAPAAAIAERISRRVTDWAGQRLHDDLAVLVIRADPERKGDE